MASIHAQKMSLADSAMNTLDGLIAQVEEQIDKELHDVPEDQRDIRVIKALLIDLRETRRTAANLYAVERERRNGDRPDQYTLGGGHVQA